MNELPLVLGAMSLSFIPFLLIIGFIAWMFFRRGRPRPAAPVPVGGAASWNAEVIGFASGALGGSEYGRFVLDRGTLGYVPDGQTLPAWTAPAGAVGIRKRTYFALDGADIELQGPMGEIKCNVSREHINRVMTNNIKDLRQRGYTDEFIDALRAHGAQVLA